MPNTLTKIPNAFFAVPKHKLKVWMPINVLLAEDFYWENIIFTTFCDDRTLMLS